VGWGGVGWGGGASPASLGTIRAMDAPPGPASTESINSLSELMGRPPAPLLVIHRKFLGPYAPELRLAGMRIAPGSSVGHTFGTMVMQTQHYASKKHWTMEWESMGEDKNGWRSPERRGRKAPHSRHLAQVWSQRSD
jgi:hypothetical protein